MTGMFIRKPCEHTQRPCEDSGNGAVWPRPPLCPVLAERPYLVYITRNILFLDTVSEIKIGVAMV